MSNSPDSNNTTSLSYRDAGVDIDAGDALVEAIKPVAARTRRPGVLAGLGGFGAMFELPMDRFRNPVLVSGTDGVGTKLKLAMEMDKHDTIGIDLVAMCVNDLIVQGAEPLFFLDYYATGKLSVENASAVVRGIGDGCEQAGCALIGGETAEMPGMYQGEDYDLAGFCVGVVEKEKIIDGSKVKAGDLIVGIGSSGPHSNGYSLVRKIVEVSGAKLSDPFAGSTLGETLLAPTHIYIKPLLELFTKVDVHALAHITGGGLLENIPRVLPEGRKAHLYSHAWQRPAIFDWLQEQGNVASEEMYRTFNCGIGMVVIIDPEDLDTTLECLRRYHEIVEHIGTIKSAGSGDNPVEIE